MSTFFVSKWPQRNLCNLIINKKVHNFHRWRRRGGKKKLFYHSTWKKKLNLNTSSSDKSNQTSPPPRLLCETLPCVAFESPIRRDHINTRWLEGKFPREYQFSMIVSTFRQIKLKLGFPLTWLDLKTLHKKNKKQKF